MQIRDIAKILQPLLWLFKNVQISYSVYRPSSMPQIMKDDWQKTTLLQQ